MVMFYHSGGYQWSFTERHPGASALQNINKKSGRGAEK